MRNNNTFALVLTITSLALPTLTNAHSGGLNAQGCHADQSRTIATDRKLLPPQIAPKSKNRRQAFVTQKIHDTINKRSVLLRMTP